MAITTTCLKFLITAAKQNNVSFEKTVTLGHLENMVSKESLKIWPGNDPRILDESKINWADKFSDSFFFALGAHVSDSIDYSNFENANLIYDLNNPLPDQLNDSYTAVIDGGTLEHVFNFPQAIINCMRLIKLNGHFVGFSPMNNLMGHGFYQFSPELYYRIFSEQNGFRIERFSLVAADFTEETDYCYDVPDPASLKERIMLKNNQVTIAMIVAKKIKDTTLFDTTPYQSDYSNSWENPGLSREEKAESPGLLREMYRKILSEKKRKKLRKIYIAIFGKKSSGENLEKINKRFFIRKKI